METTSGKFGALHCKASSVPSIAVVRYQAKGHHADETSVARESTEGHTIPWG